MRKDAMAWAHAGERWDRSDEDMHPWTRNAQGHAAHGESLASWVASAPSHYIRRKFWILRSSPECWMHHTSQDTSKDTKIFKKCSCLQLGLVHECRRCARKRKDGRRGPIEFPWRGSIHSGPRRQNTTDDEDQDSRRMHDSFHSNAEIAAPLTPCFQS